MTNPTPIPFTPADPARLFDQLLDPHLSLHDLAARHNTSIEALSLYLARPDVHARIDALDTFAATRTRLVTDAQLPLIAGILTDILRAYHNNELAPPRSADAADNPATPPVAAHDPQPSHASPAPHASHTPLPDAATPPSPSTLSPFAPRLSPSPPTLRYNIPPHIQRRLAANTALRASSILLTLARFNPGPARQRQDRVALATGSAVASEFASLAPSSRHTAAPRMALVASAVEQPAPIAPHDPPRIARAANQPDMTLDTGPAAASEFAPPTTSSPNAAPHMAPTSAAAVTNELAQPAPAAHASHASHPATQPDPSTLNHPSASDTASPPSPVYGACPLVGQGFSPGNTPPQSSPTRFSGFPDSPASAAAASNPPPSSADRPAVSTHAADLTTLESLVADLDPPDDLPDPTDEELAIIDHALESGDVSNLPPRLAHIITAVRNGALTPESYNAMLVATDSS